MLYDDFTMYDAYVSDIFVIDYTYIKPNFIGPISVTFKIKPLFSARYFTVSDLQSYSNILLMTDTFFGEDMITIDDSYNNDIITIPNLSCVTPKFNMSNLMFTSKIENKENLNELNLNYDINKDNGLFVNGITMKYNTYEIMIDGATYSTSGYNLYNIEIKDEYNPGADIGSYLVGKIPYIDEIIPFLDEFELFYNMVDGYTTDNNSDIEISCKTIKSNISFYNSKELQIENYGKLVKNLAIDVKTVNSNLSEIDIYNCNELEFNIYYSQNYLEIKCPSINTIGLSFDIIDVNANSSTKINITEIIKYNIYSNLELSNDNIEFFVTNDGNYYNFILDVDYSGVYSIVGLPLASLSNFNILGLTTFIIDNKLTDISIYEINNHNIDENNKLLIENNTFELNYNKKYLMRVKSDSTWMLNISLTIQSISNFDIISGNSIEFNYCTTTHANYLFELNNSNLDINISNSNKNISSYTINNSNSTNEIFELEDNVIYKIIIKNNSLGNKTGISLKIKTNLILCNEQKMIETYLNKDSTCTIIYTAQNDERISISTSGLLDTEYIEIIVENNNLYQYDADYNDEENDIYDPNASLNVDLKAGESIIITINEYYGSSGTLFIHVAVTTS